MKFKPMKDVDSAARTRFLRVAAWMFPALGFIGMMAAGPLIGLIAGVLGSILAFIIIEKFGSSSVNLLYGKRKPVYSDYEKHEGPLNQARLHKSKKEFHKALVLVNDILKQVPDLPEALYLKAQILW